MGTRHLICIYADGACQVAQYGQWDGYPEGQGAEIVAWIRSNQTALPLLRERAVAATEITKEDWVRRMSSGYQRHLSRDQGSELLPYLVATESPEVPNKADVGFAADSLFCEYAYVIDFDSGNFEAYRGFQTEAHGDGRFASLPSEEGGQKYRPVRLVGTFPLTSIPDDWIQQAFPDQYEDA